MNRFCMLSFCALVLLTAPAAADDLIAAGQWKVTTNTMINGAPLPPQVKARCLTAEQTADIGKTFGPAMTTVNSDCARTEYDVTGQKLKWRLQCKGQIDMDVAGEFNFDSPSHYTATVITKGWMGGMLTNDVKTELEGERVSECAP
jgi:hypothetical protein